METHAIYVSGYKSDTTLDDLILYFQSDKQNVGDVDDESCKMENNCAVIMFEEQEDQQRVLRKKSFQLGGTTVKVSRYPTPTAPKADVKKVKKEPKRVEKKAIISEVKTIIVTGVSPTTTDDTLQLFFENERRSGGENIETLKRVAPDVAHITYKSSKVAQRVANRQKLEIDGYLLDIKTGKPEVILPTDTNKVYIENINFPTTTRDSLINYMENASGDIAVRDVVFGKRNNAVATFEGVPDMDKIRRKAKVKQLEGSQLKISQPPLCNSVLVTGLSPSTTKSTLEVHFETPKNGGGQILEVLHRKSDGKAVISFYDPHVVETLNCKTIDNANLKIRPYYPFMEDDFVADETEAITTTVLSINQDIFQHISNSCQTEILEHYDFDIKDAAVNYDEEKEELTITNTKKGDQFKSYIEQFDVEEIQVANIVVKEAKDEVYELLPRNESAVSAEFDVDACRIVLTGKKKKVKKYRKKLETEMRELEKKKEFSSDNIDGLDESKLTYMKSSGFENNFTAAQVKIDPPRGVVQIKGPSDLVSKIKTQALKEYATLRDESVEVNPRQMKYLKFGGLETVNIHFANKKAIVCLGEQNQVTLVSVRSENARKNKQHLLECIHEASYTFDDEGSLELLQSNDWSQRKRHWEEAGVVLLEEGEKVWIIGNKQAVGNVHEDMSKFVEVNTIVTESAPFDDGINRYLITYCNKEQERISRKLQDNIVQFLHDENDCFQIQGTRNGVREAIKELKLFVNSLTHDKILVKSLAIWKYFGTDSGQITIRGIESAEKCTISFPGHVPARARSVAQTASVLLCSFETPENITMSVYHGDITTHPCDILVNAANEELKHIGGLAAAVVSKGGKGIQDECHAHVKNNGSLAPGEFYRGSAGQLPCSNIIHVVGPRWDNFNRVKHIDVLGTACEKILTNTSKNKQQIVAFPAVGSGVFGVPKDTCANVMVGSTLKWCSKQDGTSSVREIHFVNNDKETAGVFHKEFRKRFSSRNTYDEGTAKQRRPTLIARAPVQTRDEPWSRPSNKTKATSQNLKISVVVGDISTHKADVLVNTTSETLDLSRNPCSIAFSNQGGAALQKLCNEIGGLQAGEIGETKSTGNIQSQRIYHVVCVNYNNGKGVPVLRDIIRGCLKKCSDDGYTSIAFPAIGTGVLGFPHAEAAKISFEEAIRYDKKNPESTLTSVCFVMYHKDSTSIKAFQSEAVNRSTGTKIDVVQRVGSRKEQRRAVSEATAAAGGDGGSSFIKEYDNGASITVANGVIHIVKGDITKEKTDVIAHLSNTEGSMNGGVAKALIKNGGKKWASKFRDGIGKIPLYDTVLTEAGDLNTNEIAHMAGPDGPDVKDIQQCVEKCLEKVSRKKCTSVAFPAIGTGQLSISAKDSVQAMLSAIVGHLRTNKGPIDTVRIVIFDQRVFGKFLSEAKTYFSGESKEDSPGILQSIKDSFFGLFSSSSSRTEEERSGEPKELAVCCASKQSFDGVKSKVEKVIWDMTMKEVVKDEHIEELSVREKKSIERKCAENGIEVEIEKQRITLEGLREKVLSVKSEIIAKLSDHKVDKYVKEKAELLAESVRWCWLDDTEEMVEYEPALNEKIEKAYKDKEKTVQFELGEGKCEIRFQDMIETNKETKRKTKVTRKDLKAISLPEYWDPQSKDAQGKETKCDVIQLNQQKHAEEYKKVSDGFTQTASRSNIVKIERIQNPSLFRLYATKKQNLDERHGSNERMLYHGTATSNVPDINQNGLNRNYKGVNGTVHGHGIYFARDAQMSTGFAKPDVSGNRSMYVARVAVGQYTQSQSNMIVPPAKPGSPNEKYDCVVDNVSNPSIFVMFYDNEFYPEYLITFR